MSEEIEEFIEEEVEEVEVVDDDPTALTDEELDNIADTAIAALKDVNGFNQKTDNCNGERLIYEGLRMLGKIYSNRIIEILGLMLKFDENERPNFMELVRYLAKNNDYTPKPEMTLLQYLGKKKKEKLKN